MNQPQNPPAPDVGIIDLNAFKEFSAAKRVRKVVSKTGQLVTEIVCYEPGQSSVAHQHPRQDETFFVLDGCVNMNVGGVEHVMPAGSAMSVKAGTMHDARNLSNGRSVFVFVKVDIAVIDAAKPSTAPKAAPPATKT